MANEAAMVDSAIAHRSHRKVWTNQNFFKEEPGSKPISLRRKKNGSIGETSMATELKASDFVNLFCFWTLFNCYLIANASP